MNCKGVDPTCQGVNNAPVIYTKYTKRCSPKREMEDCIPGGYSPKRYNPGSLNFYIFDYPHQTAWGKPLENNGFDWKMYQATGYLKPIEYTRKPYCYPNRYY